MAVTVVMPKQGQSVESCIITKWHKRVGDAVRPGEMLFSFETDKAAFDEEAKDEGVVLAILHEEGEDVPCLEAVAIIGAAGEKVEVQAPVFAQEAEDTPAQKLEAKVAVAPTQEEAMHVDAVFSGKISPRARALAQRLHVEPSLAAPSGPNGRVIARDIDDLALSGVGATKAADPAFQGGRGTAIGGRVSSEDMTVTAPSPAAEERGAALPQAAYTDEKLPNIRKVIARTMHQSLSTMAQLTHNAAYDASAIVAMRKVFKESDPAFGLDKVTLNDMIVFVLARMLAKPEHRALNAHLLDDTMRYFSGVHLGIAVDTPRGLMVPTLRDADKLSLGEISVRIKTLVKDCQSGAISPDSLSGGTFTVSNLGSLGIETFTPVINPPQTGILGVNTIVDRVRAGKNGAIEVYPAMSLSLTYDHRALDGAPASRFLRDLGQGLENIQLMLALG